MRGIDFEAGTDEVLEIGTGRIDRIYVLVPDAEGQFHVSSGGVYSYYEFPWPTTDRLTDEQWWKMLKRGQAPDRPAWTAPLFPQAHVQRSCRSAPRCSHPSPRRRMPTSNADHGCSGHPRRKPW